MLLAWNNSTLQVALACGLAAHPRLRVRTGCLKGLLSNCRRGRTGDLLEVGKMLHLPLPDLPGLRRAVARRQARADDADRDADYDAGGKVDKEQAGGRGADGGFGVRAAPRLATAASVARLLASWGAEGRVPAEY